MNPIRKVRENMFADDPIDIEAVRKERGKLKMNKYEFEVSTRVIGMVAVEASSEEEARSIIDKYMAEDKHIYDMLKEGYITEEEAYGPYSFLDSNDYGAYLISDDEGGYINAHVRCL